MKIYPFRAAVGFLILFLSIILFLTSADILPWSIWLFVWQFWPIVFVVFGLAFLMKKWNTNFFVSIPVFILIFSLTGAGIWMTWENQYFNTENFVEENVRGMRETRLSSELPKNIKEAGVKVRLGAGDIKVDAMGDETSTLMYEGSHNSNFFNLNQKLETLGSKGKLQFQTSPFVKKPFSSKSVNELNLNLSKKLKYEMEIESGASDIDLKLEKLEVNKLNLDTGASNLMVWLGNKNNIDIVVKSGASSLKFYIPKDMGVKVTSKSALSSNNFSDFGLTKVKKTWESKNLKDAKQTVNIEIGSGVSKIELLPIM